MTSDRDAFIKKMLNKLYAWMITQDALKQVMLVLVNILIFLKFNSFEFRL